MRIPTILLSLALAVAPACAWAVDSSHIEARLHDTTAAFARNRSFNGVVLVANAQGVVLNEAYGESSLELDTPLQPQDVFRVGSLTKPLTAVLVLSIVNDGLLSLEGTLGEYLPELYAGTPASTVTVQQLLSHTSGIKDLPANYNDPFWRVYARQTFMPDVFAKTWIRPEIIDPPGKWRYNNNGFYLLGLIVEKVTGQPYAEALTHRVLIPAGMTHSGVFDGSTVVPRLVNGYTRSDAGEMIRPMIVDPTVSYAAAAAYSNADDLLAFSRTLNGDQLLPQSLKLQMFTDRGNGYGLGWGIEEWPASGGAKMSVQTHTGSIPGYQTIFVRANDGTVVVVLSNFWQGITSLELARALFAVAHGEQAVVPKRQLADLITPLAARNDLTAMQAAYETSVAASPDAYDLSENALNSLGYSLLRKGFRDPAVRVFEWNAASHPQSSNVHDSLGEAYLAVGRQQEAKQSYEAALRLDPESQSARSALASMGTTNIK
ncbi:serine hydrolase [Brevundimonas vesicularis]|uniref:serine hydrolase domain-containing protein n=1 Tax=Brevundimonas vesicularis TaxID=41276 RepID=UPI0030BEED8B